MAQRVIDALEAIQVDEQQREFLIIRLGHRNRAFQALDEELPIR